MERDFKGLLGGVKLDEAGRVVSAEAALYQFSGEMNVAQARIEAERPQSMDPAQSAQLVDLATLDMEAALTEIVTNKSWFKDGFECSPAVFRGYWDASYALLMADVPLAFLGFAIVYVYVTVMLGKFDLIESRVLLLLTTLHESEEQSLVDLCRCTWHWPVSPPWACPSSAPTPSAAPWGSPSPPCTPSCPF